MFWLLFTLTVFFSKPSSGTITTVGGLKIATAQQVLPREESSLDVLHYFKKRFSGNERKIEPHIAKVLHDVKLVAPLHRLVSSFSGGEQARLLLAGTLIQNPDVRIIIIFWNYMHSCCYCYFLA